MIEEMEEPMWATVTLPAMSADQAKERLVEQKPMWFMDRLWVVVDVVVGVEVGSGHGRRECVQLQLEEWRG